VTISRRGPNREPATDFRYLPTSTWRIGNVIESSEHRGKAPTLLTDS
jgi:hypothetical protein